MNDAARADRAVDFGVAIRQNVDDVIDRTDVAGRSVDANDSGQNRRKVNAAHRAFGRQDFRFFVLTNLLQSGRRFVFKFSSLQ